MLDHLIKKNNLEEREEYKKEQLKKEDIDFVKALIHPKDKEVFPEFIFQHLLKLKTESAKFQNIVRLA